MSSLANAVPRTDATRRFISLQRRQSLVGIAFVLPAVVFFAHLQFLRNGVRTLSQLHELGSSYATEVGRSCKLHQSGQRPELFVVAGHHASLHAESAIPLILLSLGLALLLNQRLRLSGLYQVIYFVPVVIPAVVSAIIWGLLYRPSGPVNNFLGLFGVGPVALARLCRVRAPWHRHCECLGGVRLRHPHSSGWSAEHSSRVRRSRDRRRIALAGGA